MSTYMLYLHINQSNLCDMIEKVYSKDLDNYVELLKPYKKC